MKTLRTGDQVRVKKRDGTWARGVIVDGPIPRKIYVRINGMESSIGFDEKNVKAGFLEKIVPY